MNVPIDANVTFNPLGEIRPEYVRIEDEEHTLHTYRITGIDQIKEENYAGVRSLYYICQIEREGICQKIRLRYYIAAHKWTVEKH